MNITGIPASIAQHVRVLCDFNSCNADAAHVILTGSENRQACAPHTSALTSALSSHNLDYELYEL